MADRLETIAKLAESLRDAIKRGEANATALADEADRIAFIARQGAVLAADQGNAKGAAN